MWASNISGVTSGSNTCGVALHSMSSASTMCGVACNTCGMTSGSNPRGVASSSTTDGVAWRVQVVLMAWRL